jgi:FkbM family methyltransferase
MRERCIVGVPATTPARILNSDSAGLEVQMSRVKSAVMKTPLYPAARSTYRAVFNRGAEAQRTRMGAFYSQFFQVGDLVFDVGANQGEYADVFAGDGARVVAVEPNTALATRLQALAREADIRLVFAAIGDETGTAILNVCSQPGFSTLVDPGAEWIENSPDYNDVSWTHTLEVPVTTIDLLAREFGEPEYVKIDVEGFEINTLRGMTFRPRYLSFEFGVRRQDACLECLEHLGTRAYSFRPILGRNYRFATREWMSLAEARDWLGALSVEQAEYGDMFAHRL